MTSATLDQPAASSPATSAPSAAVQVSAYPSTPMFRAMCAAVRADVPVLLWGNPGQGKTAKIEALGRASGYLTQTIVGSVREPADYLGLPYRDGDRTSYLAPDWVVAANDAPSRGFQAALVLFDEFTTASPAVFKAKVRILQERYSGLTKIKEHVRFIAAANPPETSVDGWDLPAPIANRLMHLDWVFETGEWLAGIANGFSSAAQQVTIDSLNFAGTDRDRARVVATITGFLTARPDMLAPTPPADPTEAGRAWPSPRSWSNLTDVLTHLPANDTGAILLSIYGCIGEAAGKMLWAWMETADLANPADVLADPSIVDWSGERPDRLFGLLTAVSGLVVGQCYALGANAPAAEKVWRKGMAVMRAAAENHRADVALPSVRTLFANPPATGLALEQADRVVFADILIGMGAAS